ncbi:unnamed protein product [Sphenostylis stenocarpa]|uniref:Uncharacterized protein n=1 Tax=Sphenostylis stenocarpa TaxID=92480 RepID=A0AA86RSD1_9FABA|nr:unnamed protein product [Sphenostylis stenocarpa]
MSEYSNKKTRGAFVAAVFAMQGFGRNRLHFRGKNVFMEGNYAAQRIFEAQIYVYGPIALKAFYLPWAMLALDVIYG